MTETELNIGLLVHTQYATYLEKFGYAVTYKVVSATKNRQEATDLFDAIPDTGKYSDVLEYIKSVIAKSSYVGERPRTDWKWVASKRLERIRELEEEVSSLQGVINRLLGMEKFDMSSDKPETENMEKYRPEVLW